jgi:hypothetical protein
MTVIYTKNYNHIHPRNIYGKGVPLLLNKIVREPIVKERGSGILTTSNVVGGILSNHPKKSAPPPPDQAVTPIQTGSGSLLDKVSVPTFRKSKKENRNNIKLVL